jgi:hypothetical protein
MATTTLTTAQAVDGVGTAGAVQITGDFDFSVAGSAGGGKLELQRAIANVDADFVAVGKEAIFFGPGHVSVTNRGTNFYRTKLIGSNGAADIEGIANQA